jgi:capsular exopolysaccharide synthesis family protein
LTNVESIGGHVLKTDVESLSLLPCGPVPPNPADLLSTGRFKEILREAEAQYDTVIVDGPPMLGLADASLLAAASGHVLMVIESGKTRTRAARDAVERIEAGGGHIVGVALTKSAEDSSYYGYRLYQYGAVEKRGSEAIMITQASEGS